MKTLHFSVSIASPKEVVWNTMLGADTFRQWTAPFMPGSYYEGSWDKGSRIRFLSPDGGGMVGEIAENRPFELVSTKYLGFVKDFADDIDSPAARDATPGYENYSFIEQDGVTEVRVDVDSIPEMEAMLEDKYPQALQVLKRMCESRWGESRSPADAPP